VLAQTHSDLEVLVVVDGPNPETLEALATVTDPRLRVLHNPVSRGAGPSRNRGGAEAKGAFIAFLDDDDEWAPGKLEAQLALAVPDEPVLVSCMAEVRTPTATYVWPRVVYDGKRPIDEYLFDRRSFTRGDAFINTSTFFLPTSVFRATGFGESRNHEDTMLLLRVTKTMGGKVVVAPQPLAIVYKEEERESLGATHNLDDMLRWLDEAQPLLTRRAYSGICLLYLGAQAADQRRYSGGWKLLSRSFAHGSPALVQLAMFASYWLVPKDARQKVRSLLIKKRRGPMPQGT
jgi:glycosyltransferase involved in cell wall biosynthesis